jgi:hypothetical protein
MSAPLTDELVRLLGMKKELLAGMLESLRQSLLYLQQDDMDAFNGEMDACQHIASKVDELGAPAEKLRERAAGARQDEIAKLESDIREIVRQIERTRQECNDAAQQKLKLYGQQIKAVRHTQKGIDGYASQFTPRDAVFVDEKK